MLTNSMMWYTLIYYVLIKVKIQLIIVMLVIW